MAENEEAVDFKPNDDDLMEDDVGAEAEAVPAPKLHSTITGSSREPSSGQRKTKGHGFPEETGPRLAGRDFDSLDSNGKPGPLKCLFVSPISFSIDVVFHNLLLLLPMIWFLLDHCRDCDFDRLLGLLIPWMLVLATRNVGVLSVAKLFCLPIKLTLFIHTHADFVVLSLDKDSLLGEATTEKGISCIQHCTPFQKEILVILHSRSSKAFLFFCTV
ncbi:hypothetical protein J5N97_020478 [Dioscorea zingiberensis]|uniref:Uncharacterized protein n=1 Tax=Dioscorea zingiberensis TaxID=325984 RepID=A0A9D5CGH8_9LILI|nr:hypothetical protein J5N97_020478 [Dioscorea zingiberensis]